MVQLDALGAGMLGSGGWIGWMQKLRFAEEEMSVYGEKTFVVVYKDEL